MHFDFTQDEALFQDTVRSLLAKECSTEHLRALSETETGRSRATWKKLAEIGLLGLRLPAECEGLGLGEVALVLPLEETGYAALPEPIVESAAVAGPLLAELLPNGTAERWLAPLATGEAIIAVGHPCNTFVADAHVASLLLLADGDTVHAVERDTVTLEFQPSIDPLRRLYRVGWTPQSSTRVAEKSQARDLLDAAFERGALATAAQQIGVARRLVDLAVEYACTREQFGQPIGAFQAIKHKLADVAVRIEFARPVVYRAAFALEHAHPERAVAVSHAKAAASEAALLAAKTALQVHGAIGYTWEVDLHFWMKRAWSLEQAWGSSAMHRERVAERLFERDRPAPSFGFGTDP